MVFDVVVMRGRHHERDPAALYPDRVVAGQAEHIALEPKNGFLEYRNWRVIGAWFVDYLSPFGSGGFYRFGDGQGTSCGVGTITRHQPVSSDRSDLCCA
ncbi:hypothetical protein AERO8C_20445 [Aeromonas veronii]|uniref:Uncharacterized protein n=1 Tax=Aeromonas veronii TaxID=654 RepID=A0A653L1Q1_AERVE|nr:hypothetical protein AERO8C_20445 [Aeromonas veronii]